MAAAGVVTVSASVPACLPMPTSAASTGWSLIGGPPAFAVSVPDYTPRLYIPVLQLVSLWQREERVVRAMLKVSQENRVAGAPL